MLTGIDPKVDYAFKRVFGRDHPVNHRLLISLLNAVLRLPPGEQITSVQILNLFHDRETLDDRLAIVDIKVKDQQGRKYTVEMQMVLHPFFPERLLYYWARLCPQTLTTGEDYDRLRPTVVICFLNKPRKKARYIRRVDSMRGFHSCSASACCKATASNPRYWRSCKQCSIKYCRVLW